MPNLEGLSKSKFKKLKMYERKLFITNLVLLPLIAWTIYIIINIYIDSKDIGFTALMGCIFSMPTVLYFMLTEDYKKRIKIIYGKVKYKNKSERQYYEKIDKV